MSKLQTIKAKLAALIEKTIEVKMGVVKTDKAVIEYDGDEDLVAGMNVFVTDENGERKPLENGEYTTEDGKVIVVADGKVESITDPVAEVDGEETPVDEEQVDAPVETPTDEEKIDAEETTPTAIDELRKEVDELYKIVDSILEKIGESRREADERFKKIETMSASISMAEILESANVAPTVNTGDAKIDAKLNRFREMNKDWRN